MASKVQYRAFLTGIRLSSYYNLRKDGRSHLCLSVNYSLEKGPKKAGFYMGVGVIVRQELM